MWTFWRANPKTSSTFILLTPRQILATGFEFSQWRADTVIGRNGQSLAQHWEKAGGIEAYKTVAMNGFPNFFYLLGPNAGSGHTSVLFAMEW